MAVSRESPKGRRPSMKRCSSISLGAALLVRSLVGSWPAYQSGSALALKQRMRPKRCLPPPLGSSNSHFQSVAGHSLFALAQLSLRFGAACGVVKTVRLWDAHLVVVPLHSAPVRVLESESMTCCGRPQHDILWSTALSEVQSQTVSCGHRDTIVNDSIAIIVADL